VWPSDCILVHFLKDICKFVLFARCTGVRNPMKISDICFLKTGRNRPQNSKTENLVSAVLFKKNNRYPRFRDGFSRCLIHSSSYSMIRSVVKVFFFLPYVCISNTESLRLTINWTNSARK